MKKLIIVIGVLIVAAALLGIFKDLFLKTAVEKGVEKVTGLTLTMEGFRAGIMNSDVRIRDLTITNPPGFKDKFMIDMPEIYVDYNFQELLRGDVHLTDVRLHVREFVVEKNREGRLNLESLRTITAGRSGTRPAGAPGKMGEKKAPPFRVDRLHLKIGTVIYRDYSTPLPIVKKFDLNIDQEFNDLTDPAVIVNLVVVKALSRTNIASLSGFDLGALQGAVAGSLALAQDAAVGAVQATLTETGVVGGDAAAVVNATTQKLGDMLKNPFGEKE